MLADDGATEGTGDGADAAVVPSADFFEAEPLPSSRVLPKSEFNCWASEFDFAVLGPEFESAAPVLAGWRMGFSLGAGVPVLADALLPDVLAAPLLGREVRPLWSPVLPVEPLPVEDWLDEAFDESLCPVSAQATCWPLAAAIPTPTATAARR
jgi:hypothetical protein